MEGKTDKDGRVCWFSVDRSCASRMRVVLYVCSRAWVCHDLCVLVCICYV